MLCSLFIFDYYGLAHRSPIKNIKGQIQTFYDLYLYRLLFQLLLTVLKPSDILNFNLHYERTTFLPPLRPLPIRPEIPRKAPFRNSESAVDDVNKHPVPLSIHPL